MILRGLLYAGKSVISSPSRNIFPESGFSNPAIILSRVDFPQPEDPKRLNNSDFFIYW